MTNTSPTIRPSCQPAGERRAPHGPRRTARRGWSLDRFRRDEDGAIVIFSVFMFLMIVLLGALGVDMMRFEMER
ncbi:MAG: hypothetical protein V2I53_11600, partial [Paracoccaceae bacterium]|nr:hypothetical protein [Paracoccaceae bacterium]